LGIREVIRGGTGKEKILGAAAVVLWWLLLVDWGFNIKWFELRFDFWD
jgi:hypothetical protein